MKWKWSIPFFFCLGLVAWAQTGSIKTPAQLATEINTLFANNAVGAITEADLRQVTLDMVASSASVSGPNVFTQPQAFASGVAFTGAVTAVTPSVGDNSTTVATTAFVTAAVRTKLTGDTSFYSNWTSGVDVAGCGTSTGNACKSAQYLYGQIARNYDTAGDKVTINIAVTEDSTSTGMNLLTPWLGGGPLTISGPSGVSPPTVTIGNPNAHGIYIALTVPSLLTIQNIKLRSGPGGWSLYNQGTGRVTINNIDFDVGGAGHLFATGNGAIITCENNTYFISTGGVDFHWATTNGGNIACAAATIVIPNPITINNTFAFSNTLAAIFPLNVKFCTSVGGTCAGYMSTPYCGLRTGTFVNCNVTGKRYESDLNSVVQTGSNGDANFLPGSTAGVISTGGQYF